MFKTLFVAMLVAAPTFAQAPVADQPITFRSAIGSTKPLSPETKNLVELVVKQKAEFAKLLDSSRAHFGISSASVEVLPPKERTFSNTVRYTFVADPSFGIAIPDRTLQSRWLSIDTYFDKRLQDGVSIEYVSSGVQEFVHVPGQKLSTEQGSPTAQAEFSSPVGNKKTYGYEAKQLVSVILHESTSFESLLSSNRAAFFLENGSIEVLAPVDAFHSNVVRYTLVANPMFGIAIPDPTVTPRRLIVDTSYDRRIQDGVSIEYTSNLQNIPWPPPPAR